MDSPLCRRTGLSGSISLVISAVAALSIAPASAQQVIAGKGSVTIDLGVLNQLGQPVTPGYLPYGQAGTYPQAVYGQPAYGQPVYGQAGYGQSYGELMFPPQQYPVSTLTVQPPVGSVPYVPPSSAASMPVASAATGSTASTSLTSSTATASTTGTPPPPPTPTATTVPTATATTTTGSETTTGTPPAASVTSTEATSTAATTPTTPAVPEPTPLATTDTSGTTATTATTATTDTTSTAAAQPAAPAATGTSTEGATAATAATGATTGATGQAQTASVPPAAATEGQIRIAFSADSAEIPDAVKAQLDGLAQKMATDDNIRIQLLAYASGTPETASRARRMSLARALAVRSYLIKQGVRSTRMDVRALGNNVEGSPADRVDIIPKAQ
jgi:outer membrane protein OmpA-like peptidoglycan-associated protein